MRCPHVAGLDSDGEVLLGFRLREPGRNSIREYTYCPFRGYIRVAGLQDLTVDLPIPAERLR